MSDENPKKKFGDAKRKVQWVPPALQLGAAVAFAEGAGKYGAYNWRETRVENMTYVGAILRHVFAYLDGENVDPESKVGKLHLEGIAACVGILLDCTYRGDLIDNRPPPGPAPRLTRSPGFQEKDSDAEGPFALSTIELAMRASGLESGDVDGVMERLLFSEAEQKAYDSIGSALKSTAECSCMDHPPSLCLAHADELSK